MKTKSDMSKPEAGFTLIEVLCVLVMIGLLSGVVVMNLPNKQSPVKIQAEALIKAINTLAQNGLVSGEVRGFGLSETHYAFYQYDGVVFNIIEQKHWDENVVPVLRIEGSAVKLPEHLSPQILFEPTGINRPFELNLSGPKDHYQISSEGNGRAILTFVQ